MRVDPYRQSVVDLEKAFSTNEKTGLTEQEARKCFDEYGPNELPEGHRDTWLSIFIRQFKSPLIYVLLISAVIIFFVGPQKLDAFIITGILLFNAIIGTVQEGRTSNIVASLRHFITTKSVVVRDGKHHIIDDKDLVPGDLIILKEGERVPADARVIEVERLKIDESMLTGESKPVHKTADAIDHPAAITDQNNMVFRGTYIVAGSGRAIVVATGQQTEVGKLHQTIEEIDTDIPLKRELTRLSYFILIFIFVICLLLLGIGLLTGRPLQELLVMLTALFICVIPEGLPVVLTLVLVTGAYRMARKQVLIKNLQGVEALGRTDVVVIDKTGTLTRNEMVVTTLFADGKECDVTGEGYFIKGELLADGKKVSVEDNTPLSQIGLAAALLNSAEISHNKKTNLFDIKGDPTEAALYVLAQKMGYTQDEVCKTYHEQYEIPFDSNLKYHAGFYKHDSKGVAFMIGAAEALFSKAVSVPTSFKEALAQFLDDGLRTVVVGMKEFDPQAIVIRGSEQEQYEAYQRLIADGITIVGLCGIQDSIRPEVSEIIRQARDVGLHVVMATGDHKKTALYVAKKVGIFREGDEVVDDERLRKMDDKELLSQLDKITVFARVSPQDKVRIIDVFHKQGNIVAMTGDGINDVPSLLAADLGIAMGQIGTEVAKQASDLVLLNDSFVNIIHAIEQGRHIFYTLRRVILYFFSTNMGEILIVLFALFTNLPLPLTAAQILWLNFVTDGFLDIGLSMEPQEPDLLSATWLQKKKRLVDWQLMTKSLYMAIPMGISSLIVFKWAYTGMPESLDYARTMTLITMAMLQWFNAWNCRSETKSIFTLGLLANRWFLVATGFVLSLQFAISYIPILQYIFKTVPLSASDWGIIVAMSAPMVLIEEVRKLVVNRFWKKEEVQKA